MLLTDQSTPCEHGDGAVQDPSAPFKITPCYRSASRELAATVEGRSALETNMIFNKKGKHMSTSNNDISRDFGLFWLKFESSIDSLCV